MNTDIRIALNFPTHPKTLKLVRRLGEAAPWTLVRLWVYVAAQMPDGVLLNMDAEDIEIAAGWQGEAGAFVHHVHDVGFLDCCEESGVYSCHDWLEHNPWASGAPVRSDSGRFSRLIQLVSKPVAAALHQAGVVAVSREQYSAVLRLAKSGVSPADIINVLATAGVSLATAGVPLAPAPVLSPSQDQNQNLLSDDDSSQASTTPLPPTTGKVSSSRLMSLNEFRARFQESAGELMPGGCNNRAGELCRRHPRDALESAFEVMAVQGGKTLKYLEAVLRGDPKPEARGRDRPSKREEIAEGLANIRAVVEAFNEHDGLRAGNGAFDGGFREAGTGSGGVVPASAARSA